MKKLMGLASILLVMAMLFTGCATTSTPSASPAASSASASAAESPSAAPATSSAPEVKAVKIGYSCPNMNNTFQTYLVNAAKAEAEKLGSSIDVSDAQNDVVKQQDQVKTFIQKGVDALIVCPVDTSAMQPILDAAASAKIPLVIVNASNYKAGDILPDNVYYVGSDEHQSGAIQGQQVVQALNSKGGVCILIGGLAYEASKLRTEGVENAVKDNPGMTLLAEQTADWARDKAVDVVNGWIAAYGDKLNAICANNDEMALGAVQALKAAGITNVKVFGVDAIPDAVDSILAGELTGTVYQDSVGQGGGAVDLAVKVVNGEKPADSITWIPFVQVDATNAAQYKAAN